MKASPSSRNQAAFGLLELIAVLAIFAILAALAIPSLNTVVRGSQLTHAATMVLDEMHLARQRAISRNRRVEVRFYRYEENGLDRFRSLQSFELDEVGAATPVGKVKPLSGSVVIDSGPALSSLLGNIKDWSDRDRKLPISGAGTNYRCSAVRFLPDGSADLSPGALWFLTIHNAVEGDALSEPPANFVCLQIDTFNGQIRAFRP